MADNPRSGRVNMGGAPSKFPDELVAVIRAAICEGLGHKAIARLAGVSLGYVRALATDQLRKGIPADPKFRDNLRRLFMVETAHENREKME